MPEFEQYLNGLEEIGDRAALESQVLRAWLRASDILYLCLWPDGTFRFWNDRWGELLGYSREELSKMTFWDFVHPDDLEASIKVWKDDGEAKEGVSEGQVFFSNRYVAKDGSVVEMSWLHLGNAYIGDLILGAAKYRVL